MRAHPLGRTLRPLGPLVWQIEAPPAVVFDVIAEPYLGRTPRALADKLRVVERGADMVLAEHFTRVGPLTVTTVETVRFERPDRISFRLVRGPVPHVLERFLLRETAQGTELDYRGELGADLWALGRWWGKRVAGRWEKAVRESLDGVKREAERRAGTARRV
jgi:Polyketide cyclase / dehydrase and lipid transport